MSKLLITVCSAGTAIVSCLLLAFGAPTRRAPRPAAPERTVGELKAELAAPATQIQFDRNIASQRLYVSQSAHDPVALRRAVAVLLDYRWEQDEDSGAAAPRLREGPGRSTLAARLRHEAELKAPEVLRARLMLARQALLAKPGAREVLARRFPNDARQMSSAEGQRLAPLLALLDERGVERLVTTGLWISPRLLDPTEPLGAFVRRAFPMQSISGHGEQQQVLDRYDESRSDLRLSLRVFGEPDTLGISGGPTDFTVYEPPKRQPPGQRMPGGVGPVYPEYSFLALQSAETGGLTDRPDPRLARMVQFNLQEAGERITYPEALARVAALSALGVVSDRFASTRLRFLKPPDVGGEMPLHELLDRIAWAFQYTWRLEGNFLLFRHARWHYEELAELPEAVVKQLAATVEKRRGLSLQDLLDLSGTLTREQFWNLAAYYADLSQIRHRYEGLRLFGALTADQRNNAGPPNGLVFSDLTAPQQGLFLHFTQKLRPHHLVAREDAERRWRVWVVEEDEPPGWSIEFVWDDTDHQGTRFPGFVPIKPTTPFHMASRDSPHHWRPAGFRRVLEQLASGA